MYIPTLWPNYKLDNSIIKRIHSFLFLFTGGVFASFGPVVAPVIRSLVSKIVSASEKGKWSKSQLIT